MGRSAGKRALDRLCSSEPPRATADPRRTGDRLGALYSHSRLASFENCPKQFEFRYIQKIPSETESIEAFVGKRVHEVLERLYEFVDRGQIVYSHSETWHLGEEFRFARVAEAELHRNVFGTELHLRVGFVRTRISFLRDSDARDILELLRARLGLEE